MDPVISTLAILSDAPIMIIRHGEKPGLDGLPHGVTADGVPDPDSLTVTGWARAGALVRLFAPADGQIRPGLTRPATLFASNQSGPGGGSARELQTVSLIAAELGLTINADYGVGEEPQLVAALRSMRGPILICWEHDNLPAIPNHLGAVTPAPPVLWPADRFDVVWVLTPQVGDSPSGTQNFEFHQVPELLLPGDLSTPIF